MHRINFACSFIVLESTPVQSKSTISAQVLRVIVIDVREELCLLVPQSEVGSQAEQVRHFSLVSVELIMSPI